MTAEHLTAEQAIYEKEKERLIAEGKAGKYVLIGQGAIVGEWDTYEDALKVAYKQFGLDTRFLVKKIEGFEEVQFFSRDILECRA